MSTMYYTFTPSGDKQVGQRHALPMGKGYHFTWSMRPEALLRFVLDAQTRLMDNMGLNRAVLFRDEYNNYLTTLELMDIAEHATSWSCDERIE